MIPSRSDLRAKAQIEEKESNLKNKGKKRQYAVGVMRLNLRLEDGPRNGYDFDLSLLLYPKGETDLTFNTLLMLVSNLSFVSKANLHHHQHATYSLSDPEKLKSSSFSEDCVVKG